VSTASRKAIELEIKREERTVMPSNLGSRKRLALNVTIAPRSGAETVLRRSLTAAAPAEARAAVEPGAVAAQASFPAEDLHFKGGKIIPDLTFTNFFVGGQGAWRETDVSNIDRALAAAMSDTNLNNVLVQYFFGQTISSTFRSSRFLPAPKPAIVSRGDIERIVSQIHADGLLDGFDLMATVFNFMLPSGTILTTNDEPSGAAEGGQEEGVAIAAADGEEEKADSTLGLGGYHGAVQIERDTVYYAVGAFSEVLPDGTSNGIPVFPEPWKNVVATFYHELCEARTDPDVEQANQTGDNGLLGWVSNSGNEIGDFALSGRFALADVIKEVPLTGGGTVPMQLEFSDFVHRPEGPVGQPRPPVANE
jgi:hypothetical protein